MPAGGGRGTQLRLVVPAPLVRRVLSIEGLDRLVPIYPLLDAAIAAGSAIAAPSGTTSPPQVSLTSTRGIRAVTPAVLWQLLDALGDGLALTGEDGRITLVNLALRRDVRLPAGGNDRPGG